LIAWAYSTSSKPSTPPKWVTILIACEDWGIPPWSITNEVTIVEKKKWINRWNLYKFHLQKATEKQIRINNGRKN
jgi:hypothetical protein